MSPSVGRRLAAEALGTALLLTTVVGSGIMAQRLAGGNVALALLGNTLATGAMLVVLIQVFGPISGAHFNAAVSLVFLLKRELTVAQFATYAAAQLVGAVGGVVLAHAMFELPLLQLSSTIRTGGAQWLSELVATFGLLGVILAMRESRPREAPYAVGLYIAAAYWFTASTSFANPAVALARSLSDTFAGIEPRGVPGFVAAEFIGALLAAGFFGWLLRDR